MGVWRDFGRGAERLYKRQLNRLNRALTAAGVPHRPGGRRWRTDLPLAALERIHAGTLRYTYRGHPMLKHPFEVALYTELFWRLRPATVIEVGSYLGVSAVWFADLMRQSGAPGQVISIDLEAPAPPEPRDEVRYLKGDASRLGEVLTPAVLAALPRPLLVIEDSAHTAEATAAVLDFFAPVLASGEYIVIEDGMLAELGWGPRYGGGPGLAISRFLRAHPEFEIDADYCDRYGHNVTGNPNGYLRRR
jgi:cephalosporin hydroxylase